MVGSREQPLSTHFSVSVSAKGQYSLQSLLSSSQFAFGGYPYGNGYDPAEITGDHGIAGRIEVKYHVPNAPSLMRSAILYPFYNIGKVWNRDKLNLISHQSAAALGFGAYTHLFDIVGLRFEVAKPLTHKLDTRVLTGSRHRKPWRFFFKVEAQF